MATWKPDILPGFEQTTLRLPDAADGPVDVVVVRKNPNSLSCEVLYLHGFVDYFFQAHLAEFFNSEGLGFYAVDLRRHGRSLRPHQLPNFTQDLDEYLKDDDFWNQQTEGGVLRKTSREAAMLIIAQRNA